MAVRPILVNGNKIIVNGYLNKYLSITGQRFPYKSSTKVKLLYVLWQSFIFCCVGAYFVYRAFGLYLITTTRYTAAELMAYYPVTMIEKATWEFRWLITCYIGIIFYNNMALSDWNYFNRKNSVFKNMDEEKALLPDDRWKEVKQVLIGLGIALLLFCLLAVICDLAEIDFNVPNDKVLIIVSLHAIANIIDRFLTFPFFLLLCLVVYILGSMVESYGKEIKNYSANDLNGARKRLKKIKKCIRTASLSFQLYLSVHFLLLLCTFFLGVCSCFEQMEVRISNNSTLPSPLLIPDYSKAMIFEGNFSSGGGLLMGLDIQGVQSGMQMVNSSSGEGPTGKLLNVKWLQKSLKMIVVDMAVKTFESVLLYLVPVWLMSRLEHQLRLVVERIEDSNCTKQKKDDKHHKLFSNIEQIRSMCKYVKTATGLTVFGYTVPKFGAFMLAAFGPFAALIIRSLLLHIGIHRK